MNSSEHEPWVDGKTLTKKSFWFCLPSHNLTYSLPVTPWLHKPLSTIYYNNISYYCLLLQRYKRRVEYRACCMCERRGRVFMYLRITLPSLSRNNPTHSILLLLHTILTKPGRYVKATTPNHRHLTQVTFCLLTLQYKYIQRVPFPHRPCI
jgi:hypothetical protein